MRHRKIFSSILFILSVFLAGCNEPKTMTLIPGAILRQGTMNNVMWKNPETGERRCDTVFEGQSRQAGIENHQLKFEFGDFGPEKLSKKEVLYFPLDAKDETMIELKKAFYSKKFKAKVLSGDTIFVERI